MKKLSFLVMLLMLGFVNMFAQDPTVAPPTPTLAASDVTTIMGYYGQAEGFKLSAYSKAKASDCSIITVGGSPVWKLPQFDYAKFDFTSLDLTGRETIHFDFYTPADGMAGMMKISLNNGTASNTPQQVMSKGEWKSVDFSIKEVFGKNGFDLSRVIQLVFGDTDRTEQKTVYIGNVYAYGGTGVGGNGGTVDPTPTPDPEPDPNPTPDVTDIPSFAVPTLAADKVTTIYGHYGNAAGFKLSAYSKNGAEEVTIGGQKAWKMPNFDYAKFDFTSLDLSGRETIHIDVYTDAAGMAGLLKVGLHNGSTQSNTPQAVISKGAWKSLEFNIKEIFGKNSWNLTKVIQLILGDTDRTELKTIYIGNIYAYGGTGEGEQEPVIPEDDGTVPALAVPQYDAANVTSIFGHYGNAPEFKLSAYSKAAASDVVEVTAGEQKALKLPQFDYAKFDFSALDLSGREKLHIDIYSANMAGMMKIGLHNGVKQSNTPQVMMTMGQWKAVEIDMSVLGKDNYDLTNVIQLIFGDTDRTELRTVYIGNIFAYSGSTVSPDNPGTDPDNPGTDPEPGVLGPAPTPKAAADDVLNIYSDHYAKWANFAPQSYSAASFQEVDLAEGDKAWEISNFDWLACNIGDRNVSAKGYFHVDVFTPTDGKLEQINFGFQYWSTGQHYDDDWYTLTPGQWTSIDIPLWHFGDFDFTQCNVLRVRGSGKSAATKIYLDNIFFYGDPEDPGTEPQFKPIQDDSDGELPDMNTPMLGVNLASASGGKVPGTFGQDYIYPRFQDLYYFKAKGVRLIRFPFRAARVLHNLDDAELDYAEGAKSDIAAMKAVVDEAERLGMWVMLDAHDYSERTIDGVQHKLGDDVYTNEKFARMWKMIAEAFKDNKNIWGYDLQNEPKSNTATLLAAYQPAINAIREVDQNAFIVLEGCNWASAYQWSKPATDSSSNLPLLDLVDPQDKLVFQAHCYFDKDNSGTYKGSYDAIATNLEGMKTRLKPFYDTLKAHNKRGILGEFGVPYNGATNSDPRYMDLLDATFDWMMQYNQWATYWCAGAMYESNALSCQPDKSTLYGNYAIEKSTIKVIEKYVPIWASNVTDEIQSIEKTPVENGQAYNLQGQRVPATYKGIVIVNGKKILR